jgi:hypothetical protein
VVDTKLLYLNVGKRLGIVFPLAILSHGGLVVLGFLSWDYYYSVTRLKTNDQWDGHASN